MKKQKNKHIYELIADLGGQIKTGDFCNVTQQCVLGWANRGEIPPAKVLFLVKKFKGKYSYTDLNPKVYPAYIFDK